MATAVPAYNRQAACDAADTYLQSLGLHPLGEIEPNGRLLLARTLMEELVQLEISTQNKFQLARTGLFGSINAALNSFDPCTKEWPGAADLAENLGLIGCRECPNDIFERILSRLKGDKP